MEGAASVAALASLAEHPLEETLDGRRPLLLDHHGFVLQLLAGHADIFAVEVRNGRSGRRHHLFRLASGDIVPDLPTLVSSSADELRFIAVGSEGGRVSLVRRTDLTMQIAPEAVMFYPGLPSRSVGFRDLLRLSLRYARGNVPRIALGIGFIGLLSLVTPFVTNILISSIIPRSELDQLGFCALALGLTALSMAGIQVMQGLAMLRMEAIIGWRLQSAVIDRLLRLPTSIFRGFTAGDLVDRSMGIDAARRALTGRALRGMVAGLFCFFSLSLMLYYDLKLSLIAIALTAVRAIAIVCTNVVRLHLKASTSISRAASRALSSSS